MSGFSRSGKHYSGVETDSSIPNVCLVFFILEKVIINFFSFYSNDFKQGALDTKTIRNSPQSAGFED